MAGRAPACTAVLSDGAGSDFALLARPLQTGAGHRTDNRVVDVSVIIPTRGRPEKLGACLRGLARQTAGPDRCEVLVGFDGPDPDGAGRARAAWRDAGGDEGALHLVECPREGYNAARNRLIAAARGRIMVSLNDDVVPEPALVDIHLREQHAAIDRGRAAIITGYSPWRRRPGDTLFDRLVRETSMVFFYDRMLQSEVHQGGIGPAPASPAHLLTCSPAQVSSPPHPLTPSPPHLRDWGFRHCWGLNFSCPLGAVREIGGFTAVPRAYGYDDIELAWRLRERFGMPVLFRPEARAEHDHRYTPRGVLEREQRLGEAAWHFAAINAAFCREVFGRDVRGEAEVVYSREFVARECAAAARLEKSFLGLADLPASAVDGPHRPALINLLYEQHLLLKRWMWRKGLLDATDSDGTAA